MNGDLQETLIQEIRGLEQFFAAPPAFACEEYGLAQGTALDIKFGPDIESYFVRDGQNVFGQPWILKALNLETMDKIEEYFLQPLRAQLIAADVIDPDDDEGCDMDGNVVETRFKPTHPLKQCTAYQSYAAILRDHANQFGCDVFPGEGHWHFSVMQNSVSCLKKSLRDQTAKHVIDMQRAFPAFFVKPYLAESIESRRVYCGPRTFLAADYETTSWTSSEYSLRFKKAAGQCLTIEPRLNLHAPYSPVYLNLLALQGALLGKKPGYSTRYFESPAVLRGEGGYLSMLQTTARNLKSGSAIPRHTAVAMFENAVNGYASYLSSGFKEVTMSQSAIDQILMTAQNLVRDLQDAAQSPQKRGFPVFKF